ncbi:YoaK family protein [Streptomyces sp. NPDC002138]|uniref:YoaK family protein n=1 Tax=Streptomyces sp. NPDC002138 TaxID=3154410 RepID=UPI00332EAF8F
MEPDPPPAAPPRAPAAARRGVLHVLGDLLFPPGPATGSPGGGGSAGAGNPHGGLPPLLIVLTFVSGLVDAVSYLGLDHVFVANMTGNVAFLGFALAGDRSLSAEASAVALGAFLAGALTAGRLRSGERPAGLAGPLVAVQAVLVGAALATRQSGGGQLAVIVLLALGMGLQNGVVHRLAVPDLTTTVVTRALTGLAADRWGAASVRRLVTVLTLLAGALAGGALTLGGDPRAALALATALLLAVALSATLTTRTADRPLR